jgi:tRNA threonylcarbamoyl adenosine modification protein YeaZ
MIGLALHTSSPNLGLAISNFEGEARHQTWAFGRNLSVHLHHTLMEFVQPYTWADLSFLAVARGPGGFTGTRIGVVTARTLAQQLDIPLFGISTLEALALAALEQQPLLSHQPMPHIAVDMRAQRTMRFTAIYQAEPEQLTPLQTEQVVSPESWNALLADYNSPVIKVTAGDDIAKTVPQVLELAYRQWQAGQRPHWSEVVPYYGQHPVESAE